MRSSAVPLRIRAATTLLTVLGVALLGYTLVTTASLLGNPDPMLGLELVVAAVLVAAAAAALGVGIGLAHEAHWARWATIAIGVLLILVAVAYPFAMPMRPGNVLVVDPIALLLGASGLLLVGSVAKPYRAGDAG